MAKKKYTLTQFYNSAIAGCSDETPQLALLEFEADLVRSFKIESDSRIDQITF